MLVTSQASLKVRGEYEYPVSPLSIPGPRGPRSIEHLAGYEAVTLFTEWAQAVIPSFRLEPANAQAVAEIVRQLDGLPLAIERRRRGSSSSRRGSWWAGWRSGSTS